MILSDIDLKNLREQKCFPDNCYIGPSSVDLSLSPSYAKLTSVIGIINPEKNQRDTAQTAGHWPFFQ